MSRSEVSFIPTGAAFADLNLDEYCNRFDYVDGPLGDGVSEEATDRVGGEGAPAFAFEQVSGAPKLDLRR